MTVLNFRSPQQREYPNTTYQTFLRHVGIIPGHAPVQTLLENRKEGAQHPAIFMLEAPTGWGKTLSSMEPISWITTALSPLEEQADRVKFMPDEAELKALPAELQKIFETRQFNELHNYAAPYLYQDVGKMGTDEEKAQAIVLQGLEKYVGEAGEAMPAAIDQHGVAIFVRTRSQTQAFLRESSQKSLNAIALPSKASVCMHGCVARDETIGDIEATREQSGWRTLKRFPSVLDGTNPTPEKTPYDPTKGVSSVVARLHSNASDKCSQCSLNLAVQKRMREKMTLGEDETLEGSAAEDYLIYSGEIIEPEEYISKVVSKQMETCDLEESTGQMWAEHPTICPYPVIRNSLPEFDVAILTYPYLFNASISEAMGEYLDNFRHAIVDEAHNISGLYQQMTTQVYPGNGPHTEKLSQLLFEFDMLDETAVKELQKAVSTGLFGGQFSNILENHKRHYMEKEGLGSEAAMKKARHNLAEDGIFDSEEVLSKYAQLKPVITKLAVWLGVVQHRYMEYYNTLVAKVGENNIKAGVEPDPQEAMNILFGTKDLPSKLNGEMAEDGTPYYFTYMANAPAGKQLRHVAADVNAIMELFVELNTGFIMPEFLESLRKSKNTHIKTIGRICQDTAEKLYDVVRDCLSLAHALMGVYPEQMSHWFAERGVHALAIERGFIDLNEYIFDHKLSKDYFLNGHIDWPTVRHDLYWMNLAMSRHREMLDDDDDYEEGIDAVVAAMEVTSGDSSWVRDTLLSENITPEFWNSIPERINQCCEEITQALDRFKPMPESVLTFLQELGHPTHSRKYSYTGEFPFTNWQIYYRYWDGYFEVVPLTLGPLLAKQFQKFSTITLVSGTFPPVEYIQAFWGINPYQFKVTEKVGKMEFCHVSGVSSKFAEREFSYPRFAATIMDAYNRGQKSVLVGFPSKEVLNKVKELLDQYWDTDLFWYPSEENGEDVNDMIAALKDAAESGTRKAFLVSMGSRFTEGVEYVDAEKNSMLDTIVVCGVPYPGLDIHLDKMKGYAMEMFGLDNWGAFDLINTEMAFQRVRQTVGRGVRSDKDSCMVFLADNRYSDRSWQKRMPVQYQMPAPELE